MDLIYVHDQAEAQHEHSCQHPGDPREESNDAADGQQRARADHPRCGENCLRRVIVQTVGACDTFTDDRPEGIAVGVLPPVKQPGQEVGDQPDGMDLEDKLGESHGRVSMKVATRLPESRKRNHTSRNAALRIDSTQRRTDRPLPCRSEELAVAMERRDPHTPFIGV